MPRWKKALAWIAGILLVILVGLLAFEQAIRQALVRKYTPVYQPPPALAGPRRVRLERVASGFEQPTDIEFVPGADRLAIVLEKAGRARLVDLSKPGEAKPGAEVIRFEVRAESELGLLGLAFHPKWEENGLVYVNETPKEGSLRTHIAELRLPKATLGTALATETRVILESEKPYQNHAAGQLVFGPDGMLYFGLGDGGWMGDPKDHGQNLSTLLGSILRIDVDGSPTGGKTYAVPPDNPFVGRADAAPEIWAYGIRNPWRFTFDPKGRLVLADVGQDLWEEIDLVPKGGNMGWRLREARHCFKPETGCPTEGMVDPVFEYGHDQGLSVTGGYVYTGMLVPELSGKYLFADFTSGRMWALKLPEAPGVAVDAEIVGQFPILTSTFGRDADGEVYVADFAKGDLYRLAREGT